jgi:TolA-binding protein
LKFEEERQRINNADTTNKELRAKILEKENQIGAMEGKIGDYISEKHLLQNDLNETKDKSHKLQVKVQQLENRKDLKNRFEGRWHLKYRDTQNTNLQGSEEIEIFGNNYWIINGPDEKFNAFEIMIPDYDVEQKYFTFVKFNLRTPGNHTVNILNIISNNRLEGFENKTTAVTYTKSEVQ